MSNDFYNHGSYPTPNSPGSSALLRAELDLIAAGFDKLPALTSNANKIVAVNSTGTGLTVVNTLPSLDVIDTTFLIQDNADSTKKARFETGNITTGTTRVYTLPDVDTTLVGAGATQSLSNKTLLSPVVTGGTIDNAVIGGTTPAAGTFSALSASSGTISGSAITTAANTQTLTNKTLTSPQINNGFMNGGSIDNVTIGSGTPAAGSFTTFTATSGTIGTDTIVTRTATQTLTNKTLTSPVISGGTVDNAPIGATTPSSGAFTSLSASSVTIGGVAAVTLSGTQTLTNKTISGSSNTITNLPNTALVNSSVTIGSSSVSLGGSVTTIAGLTLTSPTITSPTIATITNVGTLTLPTSTDTLVGRATTDTLTNKTMSGASNTFSNIPNTAITGLGTMSTQNANSVVITGGSVTGITDLAIADGGTGASTAAAARVNLLPSVTGNAGKALVVNALGTDVEWGTAASGTVTSVAVSSSDLTVSGSPITSSGTISLTLNTVPVSKGGTNATTAAAARVNLLPSFTGNAGKAVRVNAGETDIEYFTATGTGTVTSITAGTGLTGGTITTAGTIAIDTTVVATLTGTQTLTNKTLTSPIISTISNTGTLTLPTATDTLVGRATTDTLTNKTISGASNTLSNIGNSALTNSSLTIGSTSVSLGATAAALAGLTSIGLANAGTGAFGVTLSHNGTLTAGRALTVNVNDADRTVSLGGNITTAGAFTTSGAFGVTLTATALTNVTLPTTGTLATLAGTESLTNKTLGSGTVITAGTINGVTIGATSAGAGTFTDLTATGNVVLGDATTDTLSIGGNAITWTGTPTHSSNHTFSGSVTVNGNMAIGDAATDTLTIAPNAVTWSNNPTHSGNHTFSGSTFTLSGSGARFNADFSNATVANRLAFQSSTTNGNTLINALPNGTATTARWGAINNSSPLNSSVVSIGITSTAAEIVSTVNGTGTALPLDFYTNGTQRLRMDTTGVSSFMGTLTALASTTTTQDGISITGRAGGTGSFRATLAPATLTANRAVTLPDAAGTVVLDTAAQTLTNKTLTSPIISTISNTGTLTLPTSTDTLVGRATTDTLTNKTIDAGTFTGGYTEEVVTANTGTAYTIDLALGTVQILTLTGNCVFTFPAATAGRSFMLLLKQDATGSRTVTWPSVTNPVKWPSSTAPTITSTASKMDKFVFTADGTNWIGSSAGQNYL